jgi:hypothetical protein
MPNGPTQVIKHNADSIWIGKGSEGNENRVVLRIGDFGQGEGRFAMLTAREARIVAYALLQAAESTTG